MQKSYSSSFCVLLDDNQYILFSLIGDIVHLRNICNLLFIDIMYM